MSRYVTENRNATENVQSHGYTCTYTCTHTHTHTHMYMHDWLGTCTKSLVLHCIHCFFLILISCVCADAQMWTLNRDQVSSCGCVVLS